MSNISFTLFIMLVPNSSTLFVSQLIFSLIPFHKPVIISLPICNILFGKFFILSTIELNNFEAAFLPSLNKFSPHSITFETASFSQFQISLGNCAIYSIIFETKLGMSFVAKFHKSLPHCTVLFQIATIFSTILSFKSIKFCISISFALGIVSVKNLTILSNFSLILFFILSQISAAFSFISFHFSTIIFANSTLA